MIENTATYDFLIENENHPRIALENAIRDRAQRGFRRGGFMPPRFLVRRAKAGGVNPPLRGRAHEKAKRPSCGGQARTALRLRSGQAALQKRRKQIPRRPGKDDRDSLGMTAQRKSRAKERGRDAYSYSARVLAMSRRRASARAKTEASENLPSAARLPAGTPVRISMPSSTVETG